ncbi:hypothetical protein E2C01_082337 [Portunus trituberculatus]|uniref:Uncharacterized protein n=1 Tax=Portunus trituberculatus TaxID=210409 RepID=A0A5B7IY76_PORTR|nr:hypothetical protein [Portunus trituberculatus]
MSSAAGIGRCLLTKGFDLAFGNRKSGLDKKLETIVSHRTQPRGTLPLIDSVTRRLPLQDTKEN